MTYTLLLFVPRKADLDFRSFKHHWEMVHVPLLKELTGSEFPLSYTRHYVEKNSDDQPNVIIGSAEHVAYDGVATLTFINKAHYERYMGMLGGEWNAMKYREDLERFVDIGQLKGVLVGETQSTGRDGGSMGWRFLGSI
jgi:hypothetical protein